MIPQGLLSKLLRRTGEGLLNLKDLLTLFPPSSRATFSGLVGRLKRGEAYLLIPQWLLAKWLSRTGEVLLNLKDLLTAFPPRLKGLFENEPVLKRFLATKSYQILPFSTKNVQRTGSNRAQNGGFSRPILLKRVKSRGWCQAVIGGAAGTVSTAPLFPKVRQGRTKSMGLAGQAQDGGGEREVGPPESLRKRSKKAASAEAVGCRIDAGQNGKAEILATAHHAQPGKSDAERRGLQSGAGLKK